MTPKEELILIKREKNWGKMSNRRWRCQISSCHLSEDFMRYYQDKLNWDYITQYQHLSEAFIREFKNKVNWDCISEYYILSEEFTIEFKDFVNWQFICRCQILSGDFIWEYKNLVDWDIISITQELSDRFICGFRDKLNIKYLIENNKITQTRLCELIEENQYNRFEEMDLSQEE